MYRICFYMTERRQGKRHIPEHESIILFMQRQCQCIGEIPDGIMRQMYGFNKRTNELSDTHVDTWTYWNLWAGDDACMKLASYIRQILFPAFFIYDLNIFHLNVSPAIDLPCSLGSNFLFYFLFTFPLSNIILSVFVCVCMHCAIYFVDTSFIQMFLLFFLSCVFSSGVQTQWQSYDWNVNSFAPPRRWWIERQKK